MKTLEACYEITFSKINFIERKIKIEAQKTIINGAFRTGKSYLIYDYLSNFKPQEYLYIDFNDPRNNKNEIKNNLENFITEKNITILILENFSFDMAIPNCENIIISTNLDIKLDCFENITLYALDFEEYLLHDHKHQNITQSFNSFLKYGNLPEIINIEEYKKIQRLQEILKLNTKDSTQYEILKILIENIDEKKSLLQFFNSLKTKIKISKDKFYETCKYFEESKIIFFIEKYNQEKIAKKIYAFNHSFLNVLSHHKKFKNEFSNLIFLELSNKYNKLYYLDYIDFYVKEENLAIVSIPFFNMALMGSLLKKIVKIANEYEISQINIITISNSQNINNFNIKITVTPFYEWALG